MEGMVGVMLTNNQIRELDFQTRRLFTFVDDPRDADTWRSYRDDVINNRRWQGDCDDLTSTALDMMAHAGQPADKMWRVIIFSPTLGINHMIGVVRGSQDAWVVGDTRRDAYPLVQMQDRIIEVSKCTGVTWQRHGFLLSSLAMIGLWVLSPDLLTNV